MSTFIATGSKNPKKQSYFQKLGELVNNSDDILIANIDNVGSRQLAEVRYALRGIADVVLGKNTMMKSCIKRVLTEKPEYQKLIDILQGNIGLIFCYEDVAQIKKIISNFRAPAPARQGIIAPCDVYVPPGPTGMDPGQTSFFQSLSIPTKIVKGQIEILNEIYLIKAGEKVNASQATLLDKLNIRPFSYGVECTTVYDKGTIYPASVLDIGEKEISESLTSVVSKLTAISMSCSLVNELSLPHTLTTVMRETLALACACEIECEELNQLKNAAAATVVAAAPAVVESKAAEPEPESESDDDMGFGLFD
ncbi:large ribosomal subunit protein uL10-like [Dermatophagoides farinae]|uniref:large ribosomal subunit protein uL10-like n=1 Tax=Dermatophagoides farinae TaxID=6954 RepID=UPI003F5F2421